MKKEDVKYFSKKFNEMADKFVAATKSARPDVSANAFDVDAKLAEEANKFATDLYSELKAAGYNDQDWNDLNQKSGAAEKLKKLGL